MKINTINSHEAVGRTIAAIHEHGCFAFLVMTDGSVLPIEALASYGEDSEVSVGGAISQRDVGRLGREVSINVRLVSAEDFDRHFEAEKARQQEQRDIHERAEFERLSKKFGTPEAK